jgi:hypothetical protein
LEDETEKNKLKRGPGGGEANSSEHRKLELISETRNPLNSRHMLNQEVKHQTN